jgi:hypothetical protein
MNLIDKGPWLISVTYSCICSPQMSGGVLSSFPKNLGKKPLMQAITAPFCRHFPKTSGKTAVDVGNHSAVLSSFPKNLGKKPLM